MSGRGFGGPRGGGHGTRIWWPAGLAELAPADRAAALERGYWADGDHIITRDGRRLLRPGEAHRLAELADNQAGGEPWP